MKTLYLIRHAKSSWKDPDLRDFERPLNKRGKRDAPEMGQRLKKYKAVADVIISSPAKRAIKTAKIIAREVGFPVRKIVTKETVYLADVPTLVEVIRKISDKHHQVMLFGHNPGLTMLANFLVNGEPVENIPTCGIFCIEFEIDSWEKVEEGVGKTLFFDYPKKPLTAQPA